MSSKFEFAIRCEKKDEPTPMFVRDDTVMFHPEPTPLLESAVVFNNVDTAFNKIKEITERESNFKQEYRRNYWVQVLKK